jgi:hypothetical protein
MTIKFEPRDVWIGWFWDRRSDGTHHYVCLIPMIVIHWVRAVGISLTQTPAAGVNAPTPPTRKR